MLPARETCKEDPKGPLPYPRMRFSTSVTAWRLGFVGGHDLGG